MTRCAPLASTRAARDCIAGPLEDGEQTAWVGEPAEVSRPAGHGVVEHKESASTGSAGSRKIRCNDPQVFRLTAEVKSESEQEGGLEAGQSLVDFEGRDGKE